jgi:hypothetical protein
MVSDATSTFVLIDLGLGGGRVRQLDRFVSW